MRVGVVSTYPPRVCGIGTFSRDLRDALLGADGVSAVDLVAIVREDDVEEAAEVVTRIHQDQRGDYAAAARVLERRGDDVVVIQHEYGIFGGQEGAHILSLAEGLRQPMVLTLHTVLSAPSVRQAETLRALCGLAALVCVFTETARRMILDARLVPPERVRVVPHGGPTELLPRPTPSAGRSGRGRALDAIGADRSVLATFGLISPGKGIEMAIAAMPAIVARHPKALYVIAGQTHPEVAKRHGEEYRISLERLARDLDLADHVVFDDRFLNLEDLSSMLADDHDLPDALPVARADRVGRADVRDRRRLRDGVDAVLLRGGPAGLGRRGARAVRRSRRARRGRQRACSTTRSGSSARAPRRVPSAPSWRGPRSAGRPRTVLREADRARPAERGSRRIRRRPRCRGRALSHLLTMVDDVGIVQHADGSVPLRSSGYCTDDVARLAIVALGLARTTGAESHHRMLARSLGFLRHAWSAEARGMRNFMSYERRWLDAPHGGDHLGRAAWALGEVHRGRARLRRCCEPSLILLREMLPALAEQRWPRTMAFAALGLARAGDEQLGAEAAGVLRSLAGSARRPAARRTRRRTGTGPRTPCPTTTRGCRRR